MGNTGGRAARKTERRRNRQHGKAAEEETGERVRSSRRRRERRGSISLLLALSPSSAPRELSNLQKSEAPLIRMSLEKRGAPPNCSRFGLNRSRKGSSRFGFPLLLSVLFPKSISPSSVFGNKTTSIKVLRIEVFYS